MIIYLLRNTITSKEYVGQTIRTLDERWKQHLKDAKAGSPYAIHRAIRKYGPDFFERSVLAETDSFDELNKLEIEHIALRGTFGETGYNQTIGGDGVMTLRRHSPETREKISALQKGRKQSPESIEKRAAARRGIKLTPEHIAHMSESRKGVPHSPEHRANLSLAHLGKKASAETRVRMSASLKGIPRTDEWKTKIGVANRGKKKPPISDSHRDKLSAALKGKPWSEARRQAQNNRSIEI
jgi:group I intron endonuclease